MKSDKSTAQIEESNEKIRTLTSETNDEADITKVCVNHIRTSSYHIPHSKPRVVLINLPRVTYIGSKHENFFVFEASRKLLCCIVTALKEKKKCEKILIGLSGGSTPKKIFSVLSSLCCETAGNILTSPRKGKREDSCALISDNVDVGSTVEWDRVIFFLVDERYVSCGHEDSNQKMIRTTLLSSNMIKVPEENLIFPNTSLPIEECVQDYNKRLSDVIATFGNPYAITLGLGDDGHLASWFPPLSKEDIRQAYSKQSLVFHVKQNRFAVKDRITISLQLICNSYQKFFFLYGQNKVDKWNQLINLLPQNSEQHSESSVLQEEPLLQVIQSPWVSVISCPPVHPGFLSLETKHEHNYHLTIVVFGASGDLATRKVIPALFSLYCDGYLPENFSVIGYARSQLCQEELWKKLEPHLLHIDTFFKEAPRYQEAALRNPCFGFLNYFKSRLYYISGQYDNDKDFVRLRHTIKYVEDCHTCQRNGASETMNDVLSEDARIDSNLQYNRLFYLALPPQSFLDVISNTHKNCWSTTGWNRVVLEKPFGRDLPTAEKLAKRLLNYLLEEETYRMDHYLGKEMVQNLYVFNFANNLFLPLMSSTYVSAVRITFKETLGVEKRGGYFDTYGIIRDILQNHLLQLLTILGMETPVSLSDTDIRNEKVKVLRRIAPLEMQNLVIGQYTQSQDGSIPGYLDDSTVPKDSLCPTFCTAVLYINNQRWEGVPFILKAGKALEQRLAEIRIQLRPVAGNIFGSNCPPNEIVIQVQPSEKLYMRILSKKPGLDDSLEQIDLDFTLSSRFDSDRIPDAYEKLILDVIKGDQQNFVRTDELLESWRILTPCLHYLEQKKIRPIPYPARSRGPQEAYNLIVKKGYKPAKHFSYSHNSSL
ncbi:glucose-6-phosphate 1-dehydrogenase-like [Hylaeus volcanicus]|uniref:glucose-6-phosphate 1-dehydrogenase-like n=1 Tax=Hylaeus volcanicus TaxID=313075 RepID=UPI0023B7F8EC|nr:glucose-6-phosphate 1-dehydrogenase-like [Hylaeus volcanicus]